MEKSKLKITVSKIGGDDELEEVASTPESRLDLLEYLRMESGKFIYEYPARFRRVVEVIRKA
jgi:hypothetical protein